MAEERKMVRSGKAFEKKPVNFYYVYKPGPKPHPKVRVLKKGDKFTGTYQHTFTNVNDNGTFIDHLLETEEHGMITVKGCTRLNKAFALLKRGTYIELSFDGLGPKKPGQRAPFSWTVAYEESGIKTEADIARDNAPKKPFVKAAPAPVVEEDLAEDEDGEEVPF